MGPDRGIRPTRNLRVLVSTGEILRVSSVDYGTIRFPGELPELRVHYYREGDLRTTCRSSCSHDDWMEMTKGAEVLEGGS